MLLGDSRRSKQGFILWGPLLPGVPLWISGGSFRKGPKVTKTTCGQPAGVLVGIVRIWYLEILQSNVSLAGWVRFEAACTEVLGSLGRLGSGVNTGYGRSDHRKGERVQDGVVMNKGR